ncbi:single-strand binding protein [Neolewinella xylanilytica]|uniref:Single-stranded DNA-binding protein n=1 Tax=Neolewinella xylanilytica TaxID=1514080 RepID=A0A2S6I160_9BACT|nr:single-stranded DNA-binding protein [Neolewinella xylanilytica]PPK84613.1 single-strand binding protein [Neolewinella xylanilytica]
MINKVTLVGRLGADPEIRTLGSGVMVAKFSVATSESYKDRSGQWQEETQWHDVVVWRNLAERAQTYLRKGSMIYLDGKLTHRKWQDKDGNPRRTTEVVGAFFRVLDGKRDGNDDGNDDYAAAPESPAERTHTERSGQDRQLEAEEDLPF